MRTLLVAVETSFHSLVAGTQAAAVQAEPQPVGQLAGQQAVVPADYIPSHTVRFGTDQVLPVKSGVDILVVVGVLKQLSNLKNDTTSSINDLPKSLYF